MSRKSKRAKRERQEEQLATAKMLAALKGEKVSKTRLRIEVTVDFKQAHKLDALLSAVRKWERTTVGAKLEGTMYTDDLYGVGAPR